MPPASSHCSCPGARRCHGGGADRARIGLTLPAGVLPDGGSFAGVNPDGSIRAKQGWWRGAAGTLVITGRRLDAQAPPLRADIPSGYGHRGFVPAALTFSTPGCWKVTGKVGGARLTYVVRVTRLAVAG